MRLSYILLAAALSVLPVVANASLVVTIERISDTVGVFRGTGTIDGPYSDGWQGFTHLYFSGADVTTIGGDGNDPFTGDWTLDGGTMSRFVNTPIGTNAFQMFFNGDAAVGSGFTGSLTVTLDAETWSSVGTSGTLDYGLGSWSIIAPVPLPASFPLLAVALGGLYGLHRRRNRAGA